VGTEIERKFVLRAAPEWVAEAEGSPILQGYLAASGESEVRLRLIAGRPLLTVKLGHGLARRETEIELDEGQFERLWPLTEGRRLEKTRYRRPLGDSTVELDVYGGALAGLVVAEVEFGSIAASERFDPPEWLGAELTGDERWANRSLATAGIAPRAPGD
jgi:CYTH domain-containing protein